MNWWQLLTSAISGGFIVKLLDVFYSEIKGKRDKSYSAKQVVDKHIDPILKSADQLLGHLFSLAVKDFKPLYVNSKRIANGNNNIDISYTAYTLYLISHFWACLIILQKDSLNVNLTERKEGRHILKFLSTLSSRKNRLLSRAEQQVIGESLVQERNGRISIKSFYDFLQEYTKNNSNIARWFEPLLKLLKETDYKPTRQKILLYGVILHALVDNLDPNHKYLRERASYPNKLTDKSRKDLKNRIFGKYLPAVKNHEKYWKI